MSIPILYKYISNRNRESPLRQPTAAPQTRPHITTSVQRPSDSLGLPKEPYGYRKRAERSRPARAVSRPLGRMDGRINNDPSVRPSGRYAPLRTAQNYGIHVI